MIFCLYQFKATKSNVKNIEDILKSVIQSIRFRPGCVSSDIWHNRPGTGLLLLVEEWESVDHLREHFVSPAYRKILVAMELCTEKPLVRFIKADEMENLGWLERILIDENTG